MDPAVVKNVERQAELKTEVPIPVAYCNKGDVLIMAQSTDLVVLDRAEATRALRALQEFLA